jgi:hypothetical protein
VGPLPSRCRAAANASLHSVAAQMGSREDLRVGRAVSENEQRL